VTGDQGAGEGALVARSQPITDHRSPITAFIGSGNYATQVLIPAFREAGVRFKTVASNAGVSGVHAGKKYGFEEATTDSASVLADPEVDTVVVATRHDTHARYVCEALKAGKHVFVEKPLCLSRSELEQIENLYRALAARDQLPVTGDLSNPTGESEPVATHRSPITDHRSPLLMIGFNRRFSPLTVKAKELLAGVREPKSFVMTVNAGAIPADHWTQDPAVGGGRIVGEACHFVDLLRFLAGAPIASVQSVGLGQAEGIAVRSDKVSLSLAFADGSFGTVHYLANGHKSFPKERLEVFGAGRILQLDNFRVLRGFGWPGFKKLKLWRQDKGQKACAAAFVEAIRSGGPSPIPFEELCEVTRATLAVREEVEGRGTERTVSDLNV
jgi:predicted dehydrogenase